MNEEFKKYEKFFHDHYYRWKKIDSPEGKALVKSCYDHAKTNAPGSIGKQNLIVVHPYYHELGCGIFDENKVRRRRGSEVKILENLLRDIDGKKFTKILFEEYLNYAKMSHQLVDDGIIDTVIFTAESSGITINEKDLKGFSESEDNFIGGVYGYKCVGQVIDQIKNYAPFFSIRPIKDAILFNELSFRNKILAMLCNNVIFGKHGGSNFFIGDKVYSLIRGVNSSEILKQVS